MKAGITGLPYSGKTTLFCALTGQDYTKLSHGKDIHVGTVKVPDARLDKLFEIFTPKKKTNATMEYFDLAGQSADKEKGMEPQALQTMKNANALILVLDGFGSDTDPRSDFDTILEDLALNDLIVVSNRIERLGKEMRSGSTPQQLHEKALLEKCLEALEGGESLKKMELGKDDKKLLRGFQFLTLKPLLVVVNISEADLTAGKAGEFEAPFAEMEDTVCAAICAEIEMEIIALEEEDRAEFLESMNIEEPAINRLIRLSYESLGLISFFTAFGPDEARAWTVRKGSSAPECAGVIHSDLERGFIRAETIAYDDFIEAGSAKEAREKGLFRIEGKDYIVKDGDILNIRFNV
jgi:ribosome-binding ATPase